MDTPPSFCSDAADYYLELMQDASLRSSAVEVLQSTTRERRLYFARRPICRVLRPLLIDERTYATAQRAAVTLQNALVAVAHRVVQDADLRRALGVPPLLETLLARGFDPGEFFMARLDSFLSPAGEPTFIESNPQSPGLFPSGTGEMDALADMFETMPVFAAFRRRYAARRAHCRDRLLERITSTYARQRGTAHSPNVAAVVGSQKAADNQNIGTPENIRLMAFLTERGVPVQFCPESQLEFRDGQLCAGDFRIDVAMLVTPHTYLSNSEGGAEHPLLAAARADAVFIPGGLVLGSVLKDKGLFALLSDPAFASAVPAEIAAGGALRGLVPWTRLVADGATEYEGARTDLLELLANRRERFVLKSRDRAGGNDVVLGWQCDAASWQDTLRRAVDGDGRWVAQERVAAPRETFPLLDEHDAVTNVPLVFDYAPYVWDAARSEGAMVRLADSDLMNMTSGLGTNTALFVCSPTG